MGKLTTSDLRKHLKTKSQVELVNDIVQLFTKFDGVKEYYSAQMGPEHSAEILDKYKKIIRNEFFPTHGAGPARLSIARKAVTDYKKVSDNLPGLIDLMIFYVEMGVLFTNTYGDIDAAFYNSMENMYESALKQIAVNGLCEQYRERCRKIVVDTGTIGWGFYDSLSMTYEDYFNDGVDVE